MDKQKQIRGELPDLSVCEVFVERIELYLEDMHKRKRLTGRSAAREPIAIVCCTELR